MLCYVPAIDQYHLVPFIQTRDTQISLQSWGKKTKPSVTQATTNFLP